VTLSRNLVLAQKAYAGALRGPYEDFIALLDEDVNIILPASLPHGGKYTGKSGAQELRSRLLSTWAAFDVEVLEYLTGTDSVVALIRLKGVLKSTGKSVDMPIAEYWRFRAGLVRDLVAYYFDTHVVVEADRRATAPDVNGRVR